ncbi:MAG: YcaO-like family protein [Candidatus Lokiarchaeota archaeon]|nr:YcaO-like family protein [Candidatus Lokiarchaeota archaeon]
MQFRVKPNLYGTAWGAQMTLFGNYDYNVRSNGKGDTPHLAILSALAEFTERVQSFLPFPIANYLPRLMLKPDLDKNHPEYQKWVDFNKILKNETNNKTPAFEPFDTTFYKFYDVIENKEIYLDQSFLISPSNGRAAGNTYEEAVVMAITEVFERYTTRMVLLNNEAVPTISLEFLSNDLQEYINSITKDDFEVYIKDFSLGKGFPVVGMLFGTSDVGYVLKSSSDLSLNRAVSRCLGDFFQNFDSVPHRLTNAAKKSHTMIQYYEQFREILESEVSLQELKANRFSSDSVYSPKELGFLAQDTDFDFETWDYSHNDFYNELLQLIEFYKLNKYRLYVRDLGWLGFPTVMVYSPDLQQYKFSIYDRVAFFDKRVFPGEKVRKFRKALLQDEKAIFHPTILDILRDPTFLYLFIFKRPESVGIMRGLPHVGTQLSSFNAWYFLGLLAFYFKDIHLSQKYFSCLLIDEPKNDFAKCAIEYLSSLPTNAWSGNRIDPQVIREVTVSLTHFPKELLVGVLDTLSSTQTVKEILQPLIVPCPYYETTCVGCEHKDYCTYGKLSPILQKLVKDKPDKLYFFTDPLSSP